MERQGGVRALVVAALIIVGGWTSVCAAEAPLVAEKMLPPHSILAIFVRDGNATAERWKATALCEVLQTPEMQQMLAPLRESVSKLTSGGLPQPVAQAQLGALCTGEAALALVHLPPEEGKPLEIMLQVVLRPADPAKGKAALDGLADWLVLSKAATSKVMPDNARMLAFGDKAVALYSSTDGALVLTLNDKDIPAFQKLHADTLARRTGAAGLSADPEYALVRSKLGAAPEAWAYVGVFSWMEKNAGVPPIMQVKPILASLGLDGVRGCIAGTTIEDRGFRTRVFVHMAPGAAQAAPALIGAQQLALVPRDVLAFSIGSADWQRLYDNAMAVLAMIPEMGAEITQGVRQAEMMIGMSIRNDLVGMLSGPCVSYATEPGSPVGQGQNFFLQVRDRNTAGQNITKLLTGAANLIQGVVGPRGDTLVRIRTIDRPHMTQVYPQSVLPGGFTPNFVIADTGWLGVDLSARAAVAKMDYFLDHKESVAARPDFAKALAKMPRAYTSISYTDVGRCFGSGLAGVQFLSDLAVAGVKIGAVTNKDFKFPVPLNQLWGMDQGRFPGEALLREKLFGSVSVTAPQADGVLYENFSPIGPIPLPTGQAGLTDSVATTSILAGMLLPALARAREEARMANCRENLSQIGKALFAYQQGNKDNSPASLADLLPEYLANSKVLVCPSTDEQKQIKNGLRCSYRYIGNVPPTAPANFFVAYEEENHERGRNVLHHDGSVRMYPEEEFQKLLAEQYDKFKLLMAKPDFPGNRERVKAFFEDKDFPEK